MENDSNGGIIVWTQVRRVKGWVVWLVVLTSTVMLQTVQSVETMLDSTETMPDTIPDIQTYRRRQVYGVSDPGTN